METSAITTVLAVATTAFAVTIFERTLSDTATSPPRYTKVETQFETTQI